MARQEGQVKLWVVPCTRAQAFDFISALHRHHRPPISTVFQLAVVDETGLVRGVATVGRPVARMSCDGWTLEVTRVATDECPNACSALYGAAWRAAKALGYRRLITYTLPEEGGSSLRGAGWVPDGTVSGREWPDRGRDKPDWTGLGSRRNDWPTSDKSRWVKSVDDGPPDSVWPAIEGDVDLVTDMFGGDDD